ncbi:PREDICTED: linker for activation of T-cells family member 2 [Merops nubicus]|uniref:linker for activation of T-cells family member 2 n=1 Tax=Merops nubicus TaxID=57421 RepID=UPI0004F02AD6|nr:PREDICTED: linker for activation of T-cells family member 2 [Merops nubicus]
MAQLELLVVAALLLLGAAVSLCVRCQQAAKREKQPSEQRSQKTTEEFGASCHAGYGSRMETRYQNFLTEDSLQGDAAYVEPISLDYYNCARFFSPPNEKEEDSHSYQNVFIGGSHGSAPVTDDAADYENSADTCRWKARRAGALQAESPDDEPDYVNTAPV